MYRKIFFFFILIYLLNINSIFSKSLKIIAIVNDNLITNIDLENETKILSIINKKKITNDFKNIAINNLIEEAIKTREIEKENLTIDKNLIDRYFLGLIKNLDLNIDTIDKELHILIKKKIKIDKLWNDLIVKKYSWKISINMSEIDKKLHKYNKEILSDEKIKEELILEEKNKKLAVFSKYHLNMLKKQSLIKYVK